MNPQESPVKPLTIEERYKHDIDLMCGRIIPKNRLEHQAWLAAEYARFLNKENPSVLDFESKDFREKIMMDWSNDYDLSMSKYYHDIENDDEFLLHPRLRGNIINITLGDVLYYKDNGQLPPQ